MHNVRVRFAPSPTGYLHVGGFRTALYCYLFAKHNNGKFILRIEDTDQNRLVDDAAVKLMNSLKDMGLIYDEGPDKEGEYGPYTQSKRTDIYRKYADILEEKGLAYKCFCTAEELETARNKQIAEKKDIMYNRKCRSLTKEQIDENLKKGLPYTLRLKVPLDGGKVEFEDLVYGKISVDASIVDDQVLLKSDGFPTYHLANVIDDHLMEISHVIRGEEWINSTPKHIILYKAFGWEPPKFAHLPLLVNKERKKLSKRHGDVAVENFIEKGILTEALLNFTALLGWHSADDREFFTVEELIKEFDFDRVSKSSSVFDYVKLDWMNSEYIKNMEISKLSEIAKPYFEEKGYDINNKNFVNIVESSRRGATRTKDIADAAAIFYDEFTFENEEAKEMVKTDSSKLIFAEFVKAVENGALDEFTGKNLTSLINKTGKATKVKGKNLWMPFRVALTGQNHGPELDAIADIYGLEKCINRIKALI